jgi:DNA-binding CsgD family transcriptional regulator
MDFLAKYLDIISKRQKVLEFVIIFLLFLSISFSFDSHGSEWFWSNYPFIAIILIMTALFLSLLWIKIERAKAQVIINKINDSAKDSSNVANEKIGLLTKRQKEIFDLILQGKSNQNIMDILFIELSTLKTHINKIYKTLEISSRKEAVSRFSDLINENIH